MALGAGGTIKLQDLLRGFEPTEIMRESKDFVLRMLLQWQGDEIHCGSCRCQHTLHRVRDVQE